MNAKPLRKKILASVASEVRRAKSSVPKVVVMNDVVLGFLPDVTGILAGLRDYPVALTTDQLLRAYAYFRSTSDEERQKWLPNLVRPPDWAFNLRPGPFCVPASPVIKSKNIAQTSVTGTPAPQASDMWDVYMARYRKSVDLEIHRRLLEMANGAEARTVFKRGSKKKRGPQTDTRNQAMAMEVLRLQHIGNYSLSIAKEHVCLAFETDIRTLEKAVKKWRSHPWFSETHLKLYAQCLREYKLID